MVYSGTLSAVPKSRDWRSTFLSLFIFISSLLAPATPLLAQVETDFSGGGALRIGDSNTPCTSGIAGAIRYDSDGTNKVGFCDGAQWLDFFSGTLSVDGHSLDASDGSPVNALAVDANGNVGIGTLTPNGNLHVVGQGLVSSTASENIATLSSGINNSVTTIPVNNTTGYPDQGTLAIYKEILTYTGKTANSFTGVTRGAFGSGADTHSSGRRVEKANFMVHEGGTAQFMVRSSKSVQGGAGRATGRFATAFGVAQAGNDYSFAAGGNGTWAFADNSFVFGEGAQTYGGGHSLAIGNGARAFGNNAIALGTKVNAGVEYGWNGFGNYSMALGLGQAAGNAPEVRGSNSFGIFMGDQSGVSVTSNNVMVLMGGSLGIGLTSPTYQLQLSTDSAAKPGTSTWTVASDQRLKDIRAPFTRGLDAIDGLETIYFTYKRDNLLGLPSDKEYVGIRAQDAQAVIPEAVREDERGFLHVTNDSIIWTAINAIKELSQKFRDQKVRLSKQEQAIAAKADLAEIDVLRVQNQKLEKENQEIKARLNQIEKRLNLK